MIDLHLYDNMNQTAQILIALSIMLFSGFLITRITKLLRLPNVSGYIIAGILIGPFVLNLIPTGIIPNMSFVSDIALGFIAFGVGKFFKLEVIKKAGIKVLVITLFESLLSMVLVTLAMIFIFKLDWKLSFLIGSIASATAPASTLMTIKQYKVEGHFVETLLQVIALDNIICLLVFSVVSSIAGSTDSVKIIDIIKPILYNISMIVIGIALALVLRLLLRNRSKDNRLIIVFTSLLALCGACSILNVSPLLSCLVFATIYVNMTDDTYLFHQIDNFTPPIMCLFFVLSGANLDLGALKTVGFIGLAFVLIRLVGKYVGSFAGAVVAREKKEVRNYLGLALIPQASVAIGLSVLACRILPDESARLLSALILSSSVLYEFIGPASAKLSLFLSKSITKNTKREEIKENSMIVVSTIDEDKQTLSSGGED